MTTEDDDLTSSPEKHRESGAPLVAAGRTTGPCGDSVSIGLVFRNQRIEDVIVETDGCNSTLQCARVVARLARQCSVLEAMAISAASVLSEASRAAGVAPHCALLATSALYRALGQALIDAPGDENQVTA
jgi:nitrogen fixation NifU-like protein